jgi:uncharacterized protein (TIGR02001 family)
LAGGVAIAALGLAQVANSADLAAPKVLPPEAATPSQPIDFVFGFRVQSDYNFRGITQSNHDPSAQSYFEAQFLDNFFYAGFATYKVDLPTRPSTEFDLTAGIRPKFGPFNFDFGIIYYNYPHERGRLIDSAGAIYTPANLDFYELAGKVSYTHQDALTLGANVFYSPSFTGTRAESTYVSGTAKYAIPEGTFGFVPSGVALSAEYGHFFLGRTSAVLGSLDLPDYNYGNVGISYTYGLATLDVRYHDTDLTKSECFTITSDPRGVATGSGRSNWCGSAVVATLSVDITASQLGGVLGTAAVAAPK